ncbi:MAG: VanZ family protein, partial [Candidatus Eremiobacteraeota bacterium]|nr:VanZ family protein [Candidatus Eremiobacteraeota bacterium]
MRSPRDELEASSTSETGGRAISHRPAVFAALVWATFVAYGSLLPFDYTPHPFALALDRFKHIAWLDVDVGDRADWMANLLLYVPLAFLCLAALDRPGSRRGRAFKVAVVVVGTGMFAVAIEFAQVFFPPRTVSLNDLIAEWLGVFVGTAIWLSWGKRARVLWHDVERGGHGAARALGIAYVIAYIGLALFPFDLLLTPAELLQKDPAQLGWWFAPKACARALQCGAQLAAEILFAVPLGVVFVLARRSAPKQSWTVLASVGLLIGAGIELAQLLIASGVSQGISVLAKTVGFMAGGLLAPRIVEMWSRLWRWRGLHPLLVSLALLYVAALVLLLDPMRGEAISWQDAMHRLEGIRLLPLYYYYYTSETRAVASALLQAALYLPPGILLALGARSSRCVVGAAVAGTASGLLAFGAQAARLLHPPQRPDPTDVLIAVVAGLSGYGLTRLLLRSTTRETNANAAEHPLPTRTPPHSQPKPALRWAMDALLVLALGAFIVRFPVAQVELALGLIACLLLMHRSPQSWLVILLILLPTLDLAPWSGRNYVDEFDAFAFALFVCGAMLLPKTSVIRWPRWLILVFGLFVISGVLSIARGLLPWPSQTFLDLAGYQSPLNALRVGRGLAWACAL